MPRTSSPFLDDSDENLEKLEMEMDEFLDEIDYRARLASDSRKAKPILRHRPAVRSVPLNCLKHDCPTPQTSPEYITKQQSEMRGFLPERKKTPCGWQKCLKNTPEGGSVKQLPV